MFQEIFNQYLVAKQSDFARNPIADKLRNKYPKTITGIVRDPNRRYKILGSPGKGNWTDCPWIAILDKLVTETPQSGYYLVFLFKADMTGVYLSLNQGITSVRENYKKDAKSVLRMRAENFRAKLDLSNGYLTNISLGSDTINARLYEAGNILAKYYSASAGLDETTIQEDVITFLEFYNNLVFSDLEVELEENKNLPLMERKMLRVHVRVERNSSLSKKVKGIRGYTCEACDFNFEVKYDKLGREFIEVHHLQPVSTLEIGEIKMSVDDFIVLCSNCHRMIHRLPDCSAIDQLKAIIRDKP